MLKAIHHAIIIAFTPEQFKAFKALTPQLLFYHGNPHLTGAPLYYGGIPHVDHFQWGNLYGVVKYELLAGEKEVGGNILVYFEDMQDRLIEECVKAYEQKQELEQQLIAPPQIIPITPTFEAPRPTLTLRLTPPYHTH